MNSPQRRRSCPPVVPVSAVVEPLQPRVLLSTVIPGKPALPLNPPGAFITNPNDPFPRPRAVLGKSKTLEIYGTFGNDNITVTVRKFNGANRILIAVNGKERAIRVTDVRRINIIGDFGDDSIRVDDQTGLLAGGNRRVGIYGDNPEQADFFGNDTISGSPARDRILGGPGNDKIDAGAGADFVDGELGADTINGGAGNDTLRAGSSDPLGVLNELNGGDGNDSLDGTVSTDLLNGDGGNDTLNGGLASDTINGGAGDDFVRGGGGDDLIYGLDGNDTLFGDIGDIPGRREPLTGPDSGNDRIYGGVGNDSLWGETGDDQLFGGDGSDTLLGHYGRDRLSGEGGDDYLNGHEEADRLSGGPGRDLFNLADFTPGGQTDFRSNQDNPNTRPLLLTFRSEEGPIDLS